MVPSLLPLSLTGTIVGEELVLFDGRGVQPILRRFGIPPQNRRNEKTVSHTIFFGTYCLVAIVCLFAVLAPSL